MKWGRPVASALVVAMALAAVACGTEPSESSGATLESWRDAACAAVTAPSEAVQPPGRDDEGRPALLTSGETRRQLKAMRKVVSDLREIPAPEAQRADVEKFVEFFESLADRYEQVAPRIEAASRRLDRVMKSIDPDELPPAPEEPTTVAGGIMSQMMSIPELADAFDDLMRAQEAATAGIDDDEAERLTERLGLSECGKKPAEKRLSADALARCGSRGKPVSLAQLVEVFREHGITLVVDEETCVTPEKDQVAGFDSDATNTGPLGLDQSDEREGHVMCDVEDELLAAEGVEVTKWPTDTETSMQAHNIDCVIYPHSTATEAEQVARMRKAMDAVAALAP